MSELWLLLILSFRLRIFFTVKLPKCLVLAWKTLFIYTSLFCIIYVDVVEVIHLNENGLYSFLEMCSGNLLQSVLK